ncbi:MAG: RDD family protein [Hymenobacter sp.]|nr:MAG: RDD family protein [Hymenobacter sp.]
MASIRVHTTQNVTLDYQVASLGERIVAALIDWAILLAWLAAWVALIAWVDIQSSVSTRTHASIWPVRGASDVVAIVVIFLIISPFFFYNLACEVFFNGQSLGKKARHLRVIRLDGTAPRLGDYFLRWLLRLIDMQFYGAVAMVTIAATGKGQRLGDLAAGTSVISLQERAAPLPDAASLVMPAAYQPVFPQAATLSDHDVALLHRLLGSSLQHDNYLLLHETASKVKELLGLHTELSDEAFLRTVLRDHAHLLHHGEGVR